MTTLRHLCVVLYGDRTVCSNVHRSVLHSSLLPHNDHRCSLKQCYLHALLFVVHSNEALRQKGKRYCNPVQWGADDMRALAQHRSGGLRSLSNRGKLGVNCRTFKKCCKCRCDLSATFCALNHLVQDKGCPTWEQQKKGGERRK